MVALELDPGDEPPTSINQGLVDKLSQCSSGVLIRSVCFYGLLTWSETL